MRTHILVAVAFVLAAGVALANPAIIITPAFITQALADARYLLLSGGALTGQVTTTSAATTGSTFTDVNGCTGAQTYFAPADGLKYAVCAKRTGSNHWAGIAQFDATNSPAFTLNRNGLNAQIYMSPTNGFEIDYAGNVILYATNTVGIISPVKTTSAATATVTNCSDNAGAAACGSAAAGMFVMDTGTSSVVVTTSAATTTSEITVTNYPSAATRLGITCNTTYVGQPIVTAQTAGTFTVSHALFSTGTVTNVATNPLCMQYTIVN